MKWYKNICTLCNESFLAGYEEDNVCGKCAKKQSYGKYSKFQVIDKINPSHYTYGEVETIDFIKSCGFAIDFCAGNVLKYVSRYKHKNGIEDIKKAQWYVNKMLELLEEVDSGDS